MAQKILIINSQKIDQDKIKNVVKNIGDYNIIEITSKTQYEHSKGFFDNLCLAITDIFLPDEKSGFSVIESLRGNPDTSSVPIIAVSKNDSTQLREKVFKYKVRDFIIKPFTKQRLENSLKSILKKEADYTFNTSNIGSLVISFDEFIEKEIKLSERLDRPFSIILISLLLSKNSMAEQKNRIDNFFEIAETKCRSWLRSTDTMFENEKKDIILILPATDSHGVKSVESKLKNSIDRKLKSMNYLFKDYFFSSHVTYPDNGETVSELTKNLFKKMEDKYRQEKYASIPERLREYANKRYIQFNKPQ